MSKTLAVPHPVVQPEQRFVVHGDGAIRSIPELGVLVIQGKEVVTQRRDTWGKVNKKAKLLSGESLQIAVKRREAKSKGETMIKWSSADQAADRCLTSG